MAIDIQPYHQENYLCIDDIIASVSNYFKKTHIFMHTKGLNFTYSPRITEGEETLKWIRTSCNYPTRLENFTSELAYLKEFVGLDIKYISGLPKDKMISIIRRNIKTNNPVAIISNTYYIPWYEQYYKKVSKLHTFLVTDIMDKYLLCVDGYLANMPVKMAFDDLRLYSGALIFKSIEPQSEVNLYNILMQFLKGLAQNHKLNNCDIIRVFANDVGKITFSEIERVKYSDLDRSDFMVGLKSIEFGRRNIRNLFFYLSDIYSEYRDTLLLVNSKMESIVEQWRLVIVFLVKGFYSNKTNHYMNRAAERLFEIAKSEEDVTRFIQSFVNDI